ncbi:MAG: endonuclease/exonuclease/phosphatase family protein [Chlamydiota bacterium]
MMLLISNLLTKGIVTCATVTYRYSSISSQKVKSDSIIPLMKKVKDLSQISSYKYSNKHWKLLENSSKHHHKTLRILTYNILWDYSEHKLEMEYYWKNRYSRVAETFLDGEPDIIGLQEDRPHLIDDLTPYYQSFYDRVGEPGSSDECCSILFKKSRFDFLSSSRLEFPRQETKHITTLKVFDKTTEKVLQVFNTHLNFFSLKKRHEQANHLNDLMKGTLKSIGSEERVIFLGDFNIFPNRPDMNTHLPLDGNEIEDIIEQSGLVDAMKGAVFGCVGPKSSYNNCEKSQRLENRCIPFKGYGTPGFYPDRIFTCPKTQVLVFAVNPVKCNALFGSDHMPIVCDLLL